MDVIDIEHAILAGFVARIEKDDPRGFKYVIEGDAADGVTVVGRFTDRRRFLIITVYEIRTASETD